MLQETKEAGLLKLEALADKLDKLPDGSYSQGSFSACAAFHHFGENPEVVAWRTRATSGTPVRDLLAAEFHITDDQTRELFGAAGCGSAGCDAKKAAAYIRKFVRERRLEGLPLHERIWARLVA